jgi:hypothetical protein
MEEEAIETEVSKGNYEAADGCRDNGCTTELSSVIGGIMGFIGIVGVILAIILGMTNGHIPTWLICVIAITFFLPSTDGIAGKVTTTLLGLFYLAIIGLGGLYLLDWDISKISNINFSSTFI